jgi:thiol:disulfide interchange protein DsbC
MLRTFFSGLFAVVFAGAVLAAPDTAAVKKQLETNMPGIKIEAINVTPVPGLFEVMVEGQLVYMTQDGRYMVHGDIYDRQTMVNLSDAARSKVRLKALNDIKDSQTIVFGPKKAAHTLTVFTDSSCGFCRKLHQEVPELNKQGVKVRYMLFPRAGLGTPNYRELQSVWCADNQQDAMNKVKAGQSVPPKVCQDPIEQHMDMAQSFGLTGTPYMLTETGAVINGYRPAAQLVEILKSGE